jgi:putative redox protein
MEGKAEWVEGHRSRLDDGRGHEVVVDLPEDEGGRDAGTSALELTVLSLAGCISTIFGLVAAKRRVAFDAIRVELTAERASGAPTIQSVHGHAEVSSTASDEDLATVLRLTMKTCPVGVIFERAKIPVVVDLRVLRPVGPTVGEAVP